MSAPTLRSTRALLAVVVGALFILVSAACRDEPPAPPPITGALQQPAPPVAADADGLVATMRAYSAPFVVGDPADAYDYLSAACKRTWTPEDWAAQVRMLRKGLFESAGVAGDHLRLGEVTTRNVDEHKGEVKAEFVKDDGSPAQSTTADKWVRFVYEDGSWRISECPRLLPAGSTTIAAPPGPPAPSTTTATVQSG